MISPGSGTSRRSERQVTLLPEPDSPTSPIVSPGRRSNETWFAATTTPRLVGNTVTRSRTVRIGSAVPIEAPPALNPWRRTYPFGRAQL